MPVAIRLAAAPPPPLDRSRRWLCAGATGIEPADPNLTPLFLRFLDASLKILCAKSFGSFRSGFKGPPLFAPPPPPLPAAEVCLLLPVATVIIEGVLFVATEEGTSEATLLLAVTTDNGAATEEESPSASGWSCA